MTATPSIPNTRATRWGLSGLGFVLFFSGWYVVTDVFDVVTRLVLPSPVSVYAELVRVSGLIVANFWPTLQAAAVGFVGALVLAVAFSVVLTASDRLRRTFMPFIVAGNSVPRVTLAPLIIFYVGAGVHANYAIAAWIAFFPLLINTVDGLANVDDDLENLLGVVGATQWQEYRYVRFVNALPDVFDGMKTGISLAVIGAVVGEFVAASEGLGYLALFGLYNVNLALVLAIVAVMGATTTVSILGLYLVQERVIFWQDTRLFGGT